MPQITVGSTNINKFGFSATFNLYARTVTLDTSVLTTYNGSSGSGVFQVAGIAFSLVDSAGLDLMTVDWNAPQIIPSVNPVYTLDLSYFPNVFLFQQYKIIGYIKEANGTVYQTDAVVKNVCQPVGVNESGYVAGIFQVIPDCVNNALTVKELTVLTYNNTTPYSLSKSGSLAYPTGTISAVTFTGTPFTNNNLYTGQYRVTNTTTATYALGDDIYVAVTYLTNNVFDVTCTNRIADLLCCVAEVQAVAKKDCENAKGKHAQQQLLEISTYLLTGLLKEINGQDASVEADFIKKALNCSCGATSIHQNEVTPINASAYSIVLSGVGGTTIPSPTVVGTTRTFYIASNSYQVSKKDTGDLAFTISTDTSVANNVKYLISFDYNVMAGYILTAFENDSTYIARLQALLVTGISLAGLNGQCVINTSTAGYTVTLTGVTAADLIDSITINGVVHSAPANTHANDSISIGVWLNSLTLGAFVVTFSLGVLTISSANNSNTLSTVTFAIGGLTGSKYTVAFQSSQYTLVQVLQAIIDYLCNLTAIQVALGNTLTLYQIDYNGNIVTQSFTSANTQNDFNLGLQNAIYNLVTRLDTLTGITCAKLAAIFTDNPLITFSSNSRVYGSDNGNCMAFSDKQLALGVIQAIQAYSDVKTAFCAIDCASPATCPEVSNISLAMSGLNIGVYGLTWAATPTASQYVTVKYKLSSSGTWIVATNALLILANGNISGTTPFEISGVSAGAIYDVMIVNNCGGVGFSKQITTPTSPIYSGSYYLNNMLYLVCGSTPVTLYSSAPFGAGVTLYTDIAMTIPKTGYAYVTQNASNIFTLNSSTGVVGTDTGSSCSTGTGDLYRVSNTDSGVCSVTQETLYTNGSFTVGGTLYRDVALTTPVTGYAYVLVIATNTIYNLNSVTGAITSSTGLHC